MIALDARAETSDSDVVLLGLDYDAPSGCPSDTEFARGIEQRTPRVRFTTDESAPVLHVRYTTHHDEIRGSVSDAQRGLQREVRGHSCADVALALTVITVIAFDPNAPLDQPSPGNEEPEDEEPPEATPKATPVASAPTVVAPVAPAPVAPSSPEHPAEVLLGLAARGQVGDLPAVAPGLQLQLVREAEIDLAFGAHVATSSATFTLGRARLVQAGLTGAICPAAGETVRVAACAGLEAAALASLTSDSARLNAADPAWRPELAPLLSLSLRLRLNRQWALGFNAGAVFQLFRHTFQFERVDGTNQTLFEQSLVSGRATVGVFHAL